MKKYVSIVLFVVSILALAALFSAYAEMTVEEPNIEVTYKVWYDEDHYEYPYGTKNPEAPRFHTPLGMTVTFTNTGGDKSFIQMYDGIHPVIRLFADDGTVYESWHLEGIPGHGDTTDLEDFFKKGQTRETTFFFTADVPDGDYEMEVFFLHERYSVPVTILTER
ncbi:MAG: hypothetical protein ILP12_02005 [Lachnospiraceae bacterium]|nr:hypothetical protein [Lachnospiraceae bacterium]